MLKRKETNLVKLLLEKNPQLPFLKQAAREMKPLM